MAIPTPFGFVRTLLTDDTLTLQIHDQCAGLETEFRLNVEWGKDPKVEVNAAHVYLFDPVKLKVLIVDLVSKKAVSAHLLSDQQSSDSFQSCMLCSTTKVPRKSPNLVEFNFRNKSEFPAIVKTLHYAFVIFEQADQFKVVKIHGESLDFMDLEFRPLQISAGNDHLIALDKSSQVWSFGTGSRGELGQENIVAKSERWLKVQLEAEEKEERIVQVLCGGWHTVAMSDCGRVYLWGWNDRGQCGQPEDIAIQNIPCLFENAHSVLSIQTRLKATRLLLGGECNGSTALLKPVELGQPAPHDSGPVISSK